MTSTAAAATRLAPRTPRGTAPAKAVRRTQEQRRTATREALLTATTGSLIDLGYADTTTTIVAERAGVSQGALFKHFPSKPDLLAETGQHLYELLTERYVERFEQLGRETNLARRLEQAIDLLWQMFVSPEYAAALDLLTASRTDTELQLRMEPVVTRHAARVRTEAAALFPEIADQPDFAPVLELILESMVGMAVSHISDTDPGHYERMIEQLVDLAQTRMYRVPPTTVGGGSR